MNLSFLIVKPDAVSKGHVRKIIQSLRRHGFKVVRRKRKTLSRKDVIFLYPMYIQKKFFEDLASFMTSGSSELFIVHREGFATETLDKLVGTTDPRKNIAATLRKRFGTSVRRNAVHSPNSEESAIRELLYFFPEWEREEFGLLL